MAIQDIRDITSFKWASVTGVNPLAILLDGDTEPLALIPDSLVDPTTLSIGSRVRVELSLRKVVIHGVANGRGNFFPGEVKLTAMAEAPAGWLLCRGQSLLRSDYPALFAAIGISYGAVDSNHFNLPSAHGRVAVGLDPAQTEFDTLGETGGEKMHTLTTLEMPAHGHVIENFGVGGFPAGTGVSAYYPSGGTGSTADSGDGQPHNNLPPYIVFNYIIKV